YWAIEAEAGGQILATNLTSMTISPLTVLADGSNSLVNLPALQNAGGSQGYDLQFVAQNGGTVWIPQLSSGSLLAVTINSGGVMPTAQFQSLSGVTLGGVSANFGNLNVLGALAISGVVTQSFPSVTNFDGDNATVSGGAVVTLPAVTNYNKLCSGPNWTVSGAGSVLDLPALTNMTGPVCGYWTIEAEAGGQFLATNLASMTISPVTVLADGTDSLVDLPALQNAGGSQSFYLQFVAQNAGTVLIPLCEEVNQVSMTAQSGGLVDLSQVQGISGSSCEITSTGVGSVVDLSNLSAFSTPLGASSLTATNDGVILLNNNVFLLDNVVVNWAGSANLPPAVTAPNSLSLYGPPWQSYWV